MNETMPSTQETEMTDEALDEFLGDHETGVLALANADEPYAIPVSYGFDETDRTVYMRLVSTPESEKRSFLASKPYSRLVVYDRVGSRYRSAVVVGQLERIEPGELTADTIVQYGEAKRPLFELWAAGKRELDIELYRLTPDSLSGRTVEIEREE